MRQKKQEDIYGNFSCGHDIISNRSSKVNSNEQFCVYALMTAHTLFVYAAAV